jgi:hypothetical protein
MAMVNGMQRKGENMNFVRSLLQRFSSTADGNERRQAFVRPDLTEVKPKPQRAVQANSKSGELLQDQLDEVLRWLSLY